MGGYANQMMPAQDLMKNDPVGEAAESEAENETGPNQGIRPHDHGFASRSAVGAIPFSSPPPSPRLPRTGRRAGRPSSSLLRSDAAARRHDPEAFDSANSLRRHPSGGNPLGRVGIFDLRRCIRKGLISRAFSRSRDRPRRTRDKSWRAPSWLHRTRFFRIRRRKDRRTWHRLQRRCLPWAQNK